MAENREYLTCAKENGAVHISEEVIASIVSMAVSEVDGVCGLGTNADSAGRNGRRNLGRSVRLNFGEETVSVACDLMLLYGYSVVNVAKAVQERVATAVESMTGCKVLGVDVNVCGITLPQ